MPSNQNKYYCFTNHVVETIYRWNHFDWVQFAVWQLERSSNGSYHHQGYVELSRRMTMTAVRSLLGEHAHISPRRGTRKEAINYCTKEETRVAGPWCWGELVQNSQGERTDLYSLRELLVRGTSISTMIEEHFHLWARHHTVIEKWFQYAGRVRDHRTELHILVGAPGTGKSTTARVAAKEAYCKPPGLWFDQYDGEAPVIMDEFDAQQVNLSTLLMLADRNPIQVPVKGGFVQFRAPAIYLVSNKPPDQWYALEKDHPHWDALMRRIDSISWFYWEPVNEHVEAARCRQIIFKGPGHDNAKIPWPILAPNKMSRTSQLVLDPIDLLRYGQPTEDQFGGIVRDFVGPEYANTIPSALFQNFTGPRDSSPSTPTARRGTPTEFPSQTPLPSNPPQSSWLSGSSGSSVPASVERNGDKWLVSTHGLAIAREFHRPSSQGDMDCLADIFNQSLDLGVSSGNASSPCFGIPVPISDFEIELLGTEKSRSPKFSASTRKSYSVESSVESTPCPIRNSSLGDDLFSFLSPDIFVASNRSSSASSGFSVTSNEPSSANSNPKPVFGRKPQKRSASRQRKTPIKPLTQTKMFFDNQN